MPAQQGRPPRASANESAAEKGGVLYRLQSYPALLQPKAKMAERSRPPAVVSARPKKPHCEP